MGSYPSADLVYGVDLGPEEDWETPWFTPELEEEHDDASKAVGPVLKEAGLAGVRLVPYGDLNTGYTLNALATRTIHATAYDPETVTPGMLAVPDGDAEQLRKAWALVGDGGACPEPGWFIVVSYG